jgi:hypothetical protein
VIQDFFSKNDVEMDLDKMYDEFNSKFSTLNHFEKDTLYYEELKTISDEMKKHDDKKNHYFY